MVSTLMFVTNAVYYVYSNHLSLGSLLDQFIILMMRKITEYIDNVNVLKSKIYGLLKFFIYLLF